MLIDIRLSELQSNTSNSIPLTLIIGISFCYYLFQFLPYNIVIIGGGTNLFGALNFKLFNLQNEDTANEQMEELFVQVNLVSASSSSNVAGQANLYNTNPLGYPNSENTLNYVYNEGQLSGRDLSISEDNTHSVASPEMNNLATASSNAWDAYLVESNHIGSIGNVMYTIFILWLIIAVLILLLAMVGAIVITIKPNYSINSDRSHSNYNIIGSALIYGGVGNKYLYNIHSRRMFSTTSTLSYPNNSDNEAESGSSDEERPRDSDLESDQSNDSGIETNKPDAVGDLVRNIDRLEGNNGNLRWSRSADSYVPKGNELPSESDEDSSESEGSSAPGSDSVAESSMKRKHESEEEETVRFATKKTKLDKTETGAPTDDTKGSEEGPKDAGNNPTSETVPSPIDHVLEKQASEMPSFFDQDGGD